MTRLLRILAATIGGLGAVALAGGGALLLRLARGPIALDAFTPHVEQALRAPDGAWSTHVGATVLTWQGGLDVHVALRDVHVVGGSGAELAVLPEVGLDLLGRALLRGRVVVEGVTVHGPSLRLAADGGDAGPTHGGARAVGTRLLDCREAQLALDVRDATVVIETAGGPPWVLGPLALATAHDDASLRLGAQLMLPVGRDAAAAVTLAIARRCPDGPLDVDARADDVDPATAARALAAVPGVGALPLDALARLSGPLAVSLRARVAADAASADIDELRLVQGRESATLRARVVRDGDAAHLAARVDLARVDVATLLAAWPPDVDAASRAWVRSRVDAGRVRRGRAAVHATLAGGTASVHDLRAAALVDGLVARPLAALPAVRGVTARAHVDGDGLRVRTRGGTLDRLVVDAASARRPPRPGAPLAVSAEAHGPLDAALAVARRLGIVPADLPTVVAGRAAGRLQLAVPTDGGAPRDVALNATLTGVSLRDDASGLAFTDGALALAQSTDGLRVHGSGRLAGAPATVDWREAPRGAALGRRVEAVVRTDTATRAALGVDLRGWLDGPADVHLELAQDDPAHAQATLTADLVSASLSMPALALDKPAGTAARATAALDVRGRTLAAVSSATLASGGTRVSARATRTADGRRWATLAADATLAPPPGGRTPGHVSVQARAAGAIHAFHLASDDTGSLLRALDAYSEARGGRLTLDGTVDLDDRRLPFDARLDVRDATLTRSPWLARLARLASLEGLVNALDGGGLPIRRLRATLVRQADVLTVRDGRAESPALGLLLSGTIETRTRTADMRGTLVPSYYGLNTAFGRVPILGTIVTGTDRQGFQAFDFRVTGPLADPQVALEASSLAPGVLRDLVRALPLP